MPTTLKPKLPAYTIGPLHAGDSLSDAVLALDASAGMELSIEGHPTSWRFETEREVLAWCEGQEFGAKREEAFEAALGAIEVVLMRCKPGASKRDVFEEKASIETYLLASGPLRDRVAEILMGVARMLP